MWRDDKNRSMRNVRYINISDFLSCIIDIIVIFCLLFEFRLGFGLTTSRVAVLFAIGYIIVHRDEAFFYNRIGKSRAFYISLCMIGIVSCVIFFNYTMYDYNYQQEVEVVLMYPHYMVYVVLYVFITANYYLARFNTFEKFVKVYVSAIYIQVLAIFVGTINTNVRIWLYVHTISNHNSDGMLEAVKLGSRICGIGLMAAGGSVMLATACLVLLYLVINDCISQRLFFLIYTPVVIATMLIGRTGFYVEIIILFMYFLISRKWGIIIKIGMVGIVGVAVLYLFTIKSGTSWLLQYYKKWIGEIFVVDNLKETIRGVLGKNVVDNNTYSANFLFGSNIMRGSMPAGGVMLADSGYLRMFNSVGILGCVFYYGAFLNIYLYIANKIRNKRNQIFYLFCIVLAFVLEFKEPFMLKYFFPAIVLGIGMFMYREEQFSGREIRGV